MFDDLLYYAKDALSKTSHVRKSLPEPQVIVFTTEKSCTYVSVDDTVEEICNELILNQDTKILKLVVMWKNGQIDLPSIAFRKAILAMNSENENTEILLQGDDGYIVKRLAKTIF